jgi:acylphosphatase
MTGNKQVRAAARLHAIVHGRVQGVNFRYYTRRRAVELGLGGYVRNVWDGTVEVVAEGPRSALDELLAFLRVGPRGSIVTEVSAQWPAPTSNFERFEVRY